MLCGLHLSPWRDESLYCQAPQVTVAQTLCPEPFCGRALYGLALSSQSHLGLRGAISFKEEVILVATVINKDAAQLCPRHRFIFPPHIVSTVKGNFREHVP